MFLKFAPIIGVIALSPFYANSKSISSFPAPTARHAICILYPNNSSVTGIPFKKIRKKVKEKFRNNQ
jgi:hypothetical protein